jgi:cytochrome P450
LPALDEEMARQQGRTSGHFAWPPGPKQPDLLQAAWLAYRPFRFLESCRASYGDAFTIRTPPLGRTPIFTRPEDVERILALDGELLLGGAAQAPVVDFAGERSLMKLDGPVHQEHREILTRALRPSGLPDGGSDLLEQVRDAVERWPIGKRFDLGAAIDEIALRLVARLAFHEVPPALMIEAARSMNALRRAATLPGLILGTLSRSRRGVFRSIRTATECFIAEKVRGGEGPTATSGCLFERLSTLESSKGHRMDTDDLRDELMTVLTAMLGGLTCAVKHAFYWVVRTPTVQARIRAEAPDPAGFDLPHQITSNPYLDAVCKEVLRLCPDIPFAVRRTLADLEIAPYQIPAATTIGVGIYLLHRRAASFPEPDRFLPERFLISRPSRFEYMPFGGGSRGCVAGPLFVFLEKLILGTALRRYQLRLCDSRENPVTSMALVSTPARPLWAIAERAPWSTRANNLRSSGRNGTLRGHCPHSSVGPQLTDPSRIEKTEHSDSPSS